MSRVAATTGRSPAWLASAATRAARTWPWSTNTANSTNGRDGAKGASILAASLAQLGRLDEARREGALFMASNPRFTIGHWLATQPIRDAAVGEHFADGYRKAGLPD